MSLLVVARGGPRQVVSSTAVWRDAQAGALVTEGGSPRIVLFGAGVGPLCSLRIVGVCFRTEVSSPWRSLDRPPR